MFQMRLRFALVLASALACAQDEVVFRGGVALVHVDAEVTSADGAMSI